MSNNNQCSGCGCRINVKSRNTEYVFEGRRFGDECSKNSMYLCNTCFRHYSNSMNEAYHHRLNEFRQLSSEDIAALNREYEESSKKSCFMAFYVMVAIALAIMIFAMTQMSELQTSLLVATIVTAVVAVGLIVLNVVVYESRDIVARVVRAIAYGMAWTMFLAIVFLIYGKVADNGVSGTVVYGSIAFCFVANGVAEFFGLLSPKVRPPKKPDIGNGSLNDHLPFY